jgi:hypothetical protein
MSRPGERLRRLATRVCTERTRRRLIDPAVADLQSEFAAARRTGSTWRTWWTLGAGYLSIAKVLPIAVCGDLWVEASIWQPEERAGARRGALVAIVTTVIATALLVALLVGDKESPDWPLLGLYLTPSTLAVTAPLGLVLGVAWSFHGAARTRKLAVAAMAVAALSSVATYANLGWLTPEANQAYREASVPREFRRATDYSIPRGFSELTWSGMRARLREVRAVESRSEVRFYEAAYHRKLAITAAPLPLVGVILALAFRRGWGRRGLTGAAVGMAVAHSLVWATSSFFGARLGAPPIVNGWLATALCTAAAVLITSLRQRARA